MKQKLSILNALGKDYINICLVNVKTRKVTIIDLHGEMINDQNSEKLIDISYDAMCRYSIEKYVEDQKREGIGESVSLEHVLQILSEEQEYSFVYEVVKDGISSECQIKYMQVDIPDHILMGFRMVDNAISREKEQRHQQELQEARQKQEISNEVLMAISKIYYAIFSIDLEKDTYEEIASDREVHHLTGKSGCASTEMVELCRSFVVPEYQDRILQFFDIHTLADRLRHEETIAEEYLAQDGNWHTARFIVRRRDDKGEVSHVLYVTKLISDEKRREENWIAIAEAAQRANQAKTDFLRHMSHDLRTPINGILGMIEMAERHKDDVKKLQECREKVMGAMEYLLSLVNNVLDIGKLENSEIILEHKSFDLKALLLKQLPVVEMQARDNGINFEGGKEMSVIRHRYLIGSPAHLNRILMNLASNAIRYNRKGGKITVYCTEIFSDKERAVYEFVCEDTGLGMSEAFQARAFEPFAQEGKKSLSTYKGAGLGLSIVKQIVEQMNGTIDMKSKENVGTRFVVTIPFEIDYAGQAKAEGQCTPVHVDVSGQNALLVEDNELNREIAKMMLEDEGLVVTMAENGKEAVDMFAASEPGTYQFVFMDIMMPVMDGLEATRRIRALDRPDAATVPILAMTANAFQDDIQLSMAAGMNAHLTKPLDVEVINQAIQENAVRK